MVGEDDKARDVRLEENKKRCKMVILVKATSAKAYISCLW